MSAASEKFKAFETCKWIVQDERLLGGSLAIRGTRIPVSLILDHLSGGWTVEDLEAEYEGWSRESLPEILALAATLTTRAALPSPNPETAA